MRLLSIHYKESMYKDIKKAFVFITKDESLQLPRYHFNCHHMWPLTLITVISVTEISLHITVETGGTYSPIRYSVHCSQRIIIRTIRYLTPTDNSLHCMWCSYNLVLFVAFTLCLWINYHHIFSVSRNFLIIITYHM